MKPYFYIDRYPGSGARRYPPAISRNIPTGPTSHVRFAAHGIGDSHRSLELWVQANGHWALDTYPGPVTSGETKTICRGRLPIDGKPETVSITNTEYGSTLDKLLVDARAEVAADDEKWARLACGQDTEEAEESGRLVGYAEGLEAALKLLKGEQ